MVDLFLVRGPKRSGNHLVVNWIASHYDDFFFWNNCYPKDFETPKQIVDAINARSEDVVIFSFEIPQLLPQEDVFWIINNSCCEKAFSPMLIRDPYNWMSSFLYKKKAMPNDVQVERDYARNGPKYWRIWADCFDIWASDSLPIDFNRFVSNLPYREMTAMRMGLRFDVQRDREVMNTLWNYQEVQPVPSSFDTRSVQENKLQPSEMRVLERYKRISFLYQKYGVPSEIVERAKNHWQLSYIIN